MLMRRISAYTPLVLLLAIAFVGFGDSFLPKPWNTMSRQSREALNNIIAKAVPSWSPKTKPYQRTEDALKRETEPQP